MVLDCHKYIKNISELEELGLKISHIMNMRVIKKTAFEGEKDPGFTVLIGIEYSSITLHHFYDKDIIFIDILSCKPIDNKKLIDELKNECNIIRTSITERSD